MTHFQTALRWQRDAACLEHPGEWWFPDKHQRDTDIAKTICRACLVRAECLAFVIAGNEDHGIWGGFNTSEIDAFKRTRCQRCCQPIAADRAATLAIRGIELSQWTCRACWYRSIAERRRT